MRTGTIDKASPVTRKRQLPEGSVRAALVSQVRAVIASHSMFERGDRVLVAVSGGADSVALLRVLHVLRHELGIGLYAAHLDHQLRGEAAREDAAFVAGLSEGLGIPCTVDALDVRALAQREKRSLEDAAREVRYTFLRRVADQVGARKVAMGHTLDDQAETVLFRLFRGSGRRGLAGIPPQRDGLFVRPLLETSRCQILAYLKEIGQPFRTDASNTDLRFARNRIRHELMPGLLRRYGAGLPVRLGRTAQILRDEDAFLGAMAGEGLCKATRDRDGHKIVLDMSVLLGYHISLRRRMLGQAFLEGTGRALGFEAAERLLGLMGSSSGFASLPAGVMAQRSGDLLVLRWRPVEAFALSLTVPGSTTVPHLGAVLDLEVTERRAEDGDDWQSDASRAAFDWGAVRGQLVLRSLRPGDAIRPFGMGGSRKVKRILMDRKVPRLLRDEVPILADAEKLLWVVGMTTSETARITEKTEKVLWATFRRQ